MDHAVTSRSIERDWPVILQGLFALVLGVVALASPWETVITLIIAFGVYELIEGVLAFASLLRQESAGTRTTTFLHGLISTGIGIFTLLHPEFKVVVLVHLIGLWALLTGILRVINAFTRREELQRIWPMIAAGALSIIIGLAFLTAPAVSARTFHLLVAGYAVLYGAALLLFGFRMAGAREIVGRLRIPKSNGE